MGSGLRATPWPRLSAPMVYTLLTTRARALTIRPQPSRRQARHRPAALRTLPAQGGTDAHLTVVVQPFAVVCAALADIGTHGADPGMQVGAAHHEAGAG